MSVEFSRQEYWSELPFPSLRDLSDPVIKPESLKSPVLAGGFFTTSTTWEALTYVNLIIRSAKEPRKEERKSFPPLQEHRKNSYIVWNDELNILVKC